MEKYSTIIPLLKESGLFVGLSDSDIEQMLVCFKGTYKKYKLGQIIFSAGEHIKEMGIVISGRVYMENNDSTGNKSIIRELSSGDTLGALYALSDEGKMTFDAVAHEPSEILFLNVSKVIVPCERVCCRHLNMIKNLLTELAAQACELDIKLSHMSMRTTRDKVMSYLIAQSHSQHSRKVKIPFNRTELAEYLCVDRSAMSKELHRMKKEGLIDFNGNTFTINLNTDGNTNSV